MPESPKTKFYMTPVWRSLFIGAWEESGSLQELADALHISPAYASVLASKLRQQGENLKHMPRGEKGAKKRLMTRTTEAEYEAWAMAAEKEGLTIGPWSRMILNRAARELGITRSERK